MVLATVVALVGWGVFAATTVTPNPNDSTAVFAAFEGTNHSEWRDGYNLTAGSIIVYVFEIHYAPNGAGGCNGFMTTTASSGTWMASCYLPTPNSTLTSSIADYLDFSIKPGCCIRQTYFSWVSGPTGNLTEIQSSGGFFMADQEGNYTMHISNTNFSPPPAAPVGNVPGTLTFSSGYVAFSRQYFTAGLVTLAVAAGFSAYSVYQVSVDLRKRRKATEKTGSTSTPRQPTIPPAISD